MRKNGFFTFCFSFIPGAGEMYLGMMFTGALIMTLFAGIIMLASFSGLNYFIVMLPIIWFYSFFNVHNLKNLTAEERAQKNQELKDYCVNFLTLNNGHILIKRHLVLGSVLIISGIYMILDNIFYKYFRFSWLGIIIRNIPTLVVATLIILLGIYLVKGHNTSFDMNLYKEKRDKND